MAITSDDRYIKEKLSGKEQASIAKQMLGRMAEKLKGEGVTRAKQSEIMNKMKWVNSVRERLERGEKLNTKRIV